MSQNRLVDLTGDIHAPEKVWLEMHREQDACDVLVTMDDGMVYTATFVTVAYLARQMELNYAVTQQMEDTPAVRYAVIDTVHVLVDTLALETIEDTIDNLVALDMFESYFTRVTENESESIIRTTAREKKRATKEHAAVVISEVLIITE